jgi:hypothetical protein
MLNAWFAAAGAPAAQTVAFANNPAAAFIGILQS